jgi:Skp family chaperone for outer membrane proteins
MRFFFLICAFLALLLMPGYALAATVVKPTATPVPTIAIIDVQRILQESLAAKSVQKQLDTRRATFQTETEAEENALRQAEENLSKSHDHIAADVYADHEQQLRQRFLAVERRVDTRRKALDQAFTDSMNAVKASLLDIVQTVAHEHGANLVLIKQQALWADPALDVTDEVLDRLNKTLPQVAVKITPEEASH